MSFRPNKPVYRATPDEIRRVSVITEAELAQTVAYSQFQPSAIPEVKIWLRVDQATDTGTLTIPDAMGGPSATQPTADRKPTLGTTGNGLAKLTNAGDDGLLLPVSAAITDSNYFGMGLWIRPTADLSSGGGDLCNMVTGAGTSTNRLSFRTPLNDLKTFVWTATGVRSGGTTRGILRQNVWKFVSYHFIGTGVTESDRSFFMDMGSPCAAPQVQTFTQESGTAASMPTTLISPVTGNAVLLNRTTGYLNGFIGDIGPDIYFYDPRTITSQKLVQLAQYRVPVG